MADNNPSREEYAKLFKKLGITFEEEQSALGPDIEIMLQHGTPEQRNRARAQILAKEEMKHRAVSREALSQGESEERLARLDKIPVEEDDRIFSREELEQHAERASRSKTFGPGFPFTMNDAGAVASLPLNVAARVLGAPVDFVNGLLSLFGAPVSNAPVAGSEWWKTGIFEEPTSLAIKADNQILQKVIQGIDDAALVTGGGSLITMLERIGRRLRVPFKPKTPVKLPKFEKFETAAEQRGVGRGVGLRSSPPPPKTKVERRGIGPSKPSPRSQLKTEVERRGIGPSKSSPRPKPPRATKPPTKPPQQEGSLKPSRATKPPTKSPRPGRRGGRGFIPGMLAGGLLGSMLGSGGGGGGDDSAMDAVGDPFGGGFGGGDGAYLPLINTNPLSGLMNRPSFGKSKDCCDIVSAKLDFVISRLNDLTTLNYRILNKIDIFTDNFAIMMDEMRENQQQDMQSNNFLRDRAANANALGIALPMGLGTLGTIMALLGGIGLAAKGLYDYVSDLFSDDDKSVINDIKDLEEKTFKPGSDDYYWRKQEHESLRKAIEMLRVINDDLKISLLGGGLRSAPPPIVPVISNNVNNNVNHNTVLAKVTPHTNGRVRGTTSTNGRVVA